MHQPTPDEEEIFFQVLERPGEQEAVLDRCCGADVELRGRILRMLAEHAGAGAFLRETATGYRLPGGGAPGSDLAPGEVIGPYRIVRQLGEGGGGLVFEAEQEQPVRRRVALKILKLGMDTRRVIARFEAERQTLALMEHPNVARVIDAGATTAGRPYFVMELVPGQRITDYCERNALSLEARIGLLCRVCEAVQHAHQKGIIHRDLKPSNILVATVDGRPVPKVIDFGIAKAVAGTTEDAVDFTLVDQPVGTPAYMSPEQLFGRLGETDTRSDIYSLGVVLYELVAGRPPMDNDELLRGGLDELRRQVREVEPPPPSRLRWVGRDGSKSELDWIVLKAIAKDRERRYQTVRALADDLERLLVGAAVEAHPPGRWYRLQKLARRNRLAAASITIAVVALAGGFTTSTYLYLRARAAERQQARLRVEAEEREHVAKAAILIMQGRHREADGQIERIGGQLTQPSIEATGVFRQLAIWNALRSDYPAAARRLLALSRVNRFDDSDQTDSATRDLLPLAPTLIEAGDEQGFRQFSRLLIDRLGGTTNPVAAEHVLKCCLQLPPEPELMAALTRIAGVAEQSLASLGETDKITNVLDAWRCTVLGLWYYRIGEDDVALRWTTLAFGYMPEIGSMRAYGHVVRGRALWRLGRRDEARSEFENARVFIDPVFDRALEFDRDGRWHDWLAARLLFKEAGLEAE